MSRNDVPLIENFLPFVPDAVILADGEYPVHEYPLRLLRETPYIVCCDGAANTFISHGYIPNMIIGDGDSLSVENRMLYKDRLLYVADQETNDLTKAIRFLLGKNFRNVVILGATGKREDHTLGNISLLMEHFPCFLHLAMVTDYGIYRYVTVIHSVLVPDNKFLFSISVHVTCVPKGWCIRSGIFPDYGKEHSMKP